MNVKLIKAHAYGNDFLMVDAAAATHVEDLPEFARRVCNRHRGVGADGLLIVETTSDGAAMRLLNADGSRSEVSGNGVRCIGAWLASARRLKTGSVLRIDTEAGAKILTLLETAGCRQTFRAAMGQPENLRQERVDVDGASVLAVVLRVGNPQCVILGPATEERLHAIAGPLAVHPFFPEGTNVELASVESPGRIRILIWERGVGPTESSGTGTCAAAVAAAAFGGADRDVEVVAPGGTQRVEWTSDGLWLTGWAETICEIDWWAA